MGQLEKMFGKPSEFASFSYKWGQVVPSLLQSPFGPNRKGQGEGGGRGQCHGPYDEILNKPFTKGEFFTALKTLKCGNASEFDSISNEMLLFQYISLCVETSLIADSLCLGIIYPHKDGVGSDPDNSRGICISSAILKLITSLIYELFQNYVDKHHLCKIQIGFKRNART